jgi:signal peptidase I
MDATRMTIREMLRVHGQWKRQLKRHRKKLKRPEQVLQIEEALHILEDTLRRGDLEEATEAYARAEQVVEGLLGFARKSFVREFAEPVLMALAITLFLWAFVLEAFKIPSRSMVPSLLDGDHIFVNKLAYGLRIPFTDWRLFNFSPPDRGDIIVFVFSQGMARRYLERLNEDPEHSRDCAPPDNLNQNTEDKDYIKRVIGLPGDTVQMVDHVLYLNHKPIKRLEIYRRDLEGHRGLDGSQVWVEEELGDNKYLTYYQVNSFSAHFGPIQVQPDHIFVMGDNRDLSFDSRCWGQVPMSHVKGEALLVWWSSAARQGVRWSRLMTMTE